MKKHSHKSRTTSKAKRGLCETKFCRRLRAPRRTICLTCKSRLWRAQNPIRALFVNLKAHAKERGHSFGLTFEQWDAFCQETNYHELKGREPNNLTVERRDETLGYSRDNITVLRHADNIRHCFRPAIAGGNVAPDDGRHPFE